MSEPVVIESVSIRGVRALAEFDVVLPAPEPGCGQLVVITGPSGSGKTTLLRCLVLALRDLGDPAVWPGGVFTTPYITSQWSGDATIDVGTSHGAFQTRIHAGTEKFSQTRRCDIPCFAYGSSRGTALSRGLREGGVSGRDGDVATLFDGGALIHAETWLVGWDGDAQKNPSSKAVYDEIRAALCTLLDIDGLDVRNRRLWVSRRGVDTLFAASSGEQLSIAGWLVDLCARWLATHPAESGFMSRMTGLYLIDGLEAGVSRPLITDLRVLFPRTSFVVTTDSPAIISASQLKDVVTLRSPRESETQADESVWPCPFCHDSDTAPDAPGTGRGDIVIDPDAEDCDECGGLGTVGYDTSGYGLRPVSGVSAFFGTWPGDETEQELLDMATAKK